MSDFDFGWSQGDKPEYHGLRRMVDHTVLGPSAPPEEPIPPPERTTVLPGRTLIILDHAGQELLDFGPVLYNIDVDQSSVFLINYAGDALFGSFASSMSLFGFESWGVHSFRQPPVDQAEVISMLMVKLSQWEPDYIFAGHDNTAVTEAYRRLTPRRGVLVPVLFLTNGGGFVREPMALNIEEPQYRDLVRHAADNYPPDALGYEPLRSVQLYSRVEKP